MVFKTIFHCCKLTKRKLVIGFVAFFLLYTEWISYTLSRYTWAKLPSAPVTLLLVSDPQIIGIQNEFAFPLGPIIRWDADWYLSKTFCMAYGHVRPDVVVFLGDNMDEGSIANEDEYSYYVRRFRKIFTIPDDNVKVVHVPGDNDIGGEIGDPVTLEKIERFRNTFYENTHVQFKFVEFLRANYFTQKVEKFSTTKQFTRILISHFPVLPAGRKFGKKAINTVQPDFIFSGHEHYSELFVGNRSTADILEYKQMEDNGYIWTFNTTSDLLYEIMVPTCSYRMGRKRMAYGAATIGEDGTVHYTLLWLPGRLQQLVRYTYAVYFVALILILPYFVTLYTTLVKTPGTLCYCLCSKR